eukprot:gnl/Chilomastix_cuspidata/2598.p1 GENE.gnl/Chilomastix_cuspidata/2598~~gnl/Chilomastix_cuspidata/2598.p1  ORF type:complete len:350 (+),score=175.14 gnl/Chilomastix_cuspidata/2598:93-1142(+)
MHVWQLVSLAGLVGQTLAFNLLFVRVQGAFGALATPIAPPPAGTMVVLDVALALLLVNAIFQHTLGATEAAGTGVQVAVNNVLLLIATATFGAWAVTFVIGPELVSYALLAVSVILSGVVFVKTSLVHVTEHPRKLSSTSLGCRQLLHSLFVLAPLGVYFASSAFALSLIVGGAMEAREPLVELQMAVIEATTTALVCGVCLLAVDPFGILAAGAFLALQFWGVDQRAGRTLDACLSIVSSCGLIAAAVLAVAAVWFAQKLKQLENFYLAPQDVLEKIKRGHGLDVVDVTLRLPTEQPDEERGHAGSQAATLGDGSAQIHASAEETNSAPCAAAGIGSPVDAVVDEAEE